MSLPSGDVPKSPHAGRWLVLGSRFNERVTDRLVEGAVAALVGAGVPERHVEVVRVAGALELPQAAARLLARPGWEGAVAVGAVVRGETPHFDHVSRESLRALMDVALETGVPVGLGVLTCDTLEQALARAGGEHGNKGSEAALAALEVARLPRAD